MSRECLTAFVAIALVSASHAADLPARGMWFWSKPSSPYGAANVVGDAAREDEALALCGRWGIRRVYGSYAVLTTAAPEKVAAWNRRLRAAGIRSEALFSDAHALEPAGRTALLRQVDATVLQFNARFAAGRFDGIALDIEPQALPRWKAGSNEDRRALLEDYVGLCETLRTHLDESGGRDLPFSVALAYWLDNLPPSGRVGWKSPEDRDAWFARLARCAATISLMAYERSRPEAILAATEWERSHFSGRTITALRARLGIEWQSLADLRRVLPAVEAGAATGVDLENYELLRLAEATAR